MWKKSFYYKKNLNLENNEIGDFNVKKINSYFLANKRLKERIEGGTIRVLKKNREES